MDNKEEVLSALEDFGRKPSENVPQILEDYLRQIAKTGVTIFPWTKLRPLFEQSLDKAMKDFHSRVPMENLPSSPNVENVTFDTMRERLLEAVKTFTGAPFTIQRLCELVTNPNKHYQRTDKYLRGIEKNVLVVSTVDPYGRKIVSESSQMIVNGMESSNNGSTPLVESALIPDKISSPYVPPAPSNSPAATSDWFTSHAAKLESPSRFPSWSSQQQHQQHPLQAMDKITEATSSSSSPLSSALSQGGPISQPVWDDNMADLTSTALASNSATAASTKPDIDPLQAAEGVLAEIEKSAADNVSSSSDSSTNESSLSDLSNDSEAEFATKSESAETANCEGDGNTLSELLSDGSEPEQTVSTSEGPLSGSAGGGAGDSNATTVESKAAVSTDISSVVVVEAGQGDSRSSEADDIESRRSSGGFETTRSVSSAMSERETEHDPEDEPAAKKPRLDEDVCLEEDLSSSSGQEEQPSQSSAMSQEGQGDTGEKEEGVGSTEGLLVSGSSSSQDSVTSQQQQDAEDVMSCGSSEVDCTHSLQVDNAPDNTSESPAASSPTDLVQSSDHTDMDTAKPSGSEDSKVSSVAAEECSPSDEAASCSAEQTDNVSTSTAVSSHSTSVCDSTPSDSQPPDSAGPEPMDTE